MAAAAPYQSFSERMFRGGLRGFFRETLRGANPFNILGRIQEGLDAGVAGSYNSLGFVQKARRVLGTALDLSATTATSLIALPLLAKSLFLATPVLTGFLDNAANLVSVPGLQVTGEIERIISQTAQSAEQGISATLGQAGAEVGPWWGDLKVRLDDFLSNIIS